MSERDDRLEIERLERIGTTVCQLEAERDALKKELAAMTARAGLAERQVAVLCRLQSEQFECCPCPAGNATCDSSSEECRERLAAWSREQAEKPKEASHV
jgi:hypothetical protein